MASRSDRNPTPRSSRPRTVSIKCGNDRPNRSSRHTHNVSPSPSAAITSTSFGRSARDPEAVSVHTHRHPAALRASCCNAGSCTVGDTLAYPNSSPTTTHCATTRRQNQTPHVESDRYFWHNPGQVTTLRPPSSGDRRKETPRTALLRKPLRSPNDALCQAGTSGVGSEALGLFKRQARGGAVRRLRVVRSRSAQSRPCGR